MSAVPSLPVVAAAAPVESFAVEPVARVEEPAPSFAPPAATVDLATASVAAAQLSPSFDAAGYVDMASSTACEPYPAAVTAVSTNAPAEASPYVNTTMPASYVPSATAAQCFGVPSSFLGSNCRL